jgi:hypothetical protein
VSILSSIISGITGIIESAATAVATAIAAPTIGTIVGAVVTVGCIVGAGYLIYKGVKYVASKADDYISNKCNPDDLPHRAGLEYEERDPYTKPNKNRSLEAISDEVAERVCEGESRRRPTKRYSLDDVDIPTLKNNFRSRFDDIRYPEYRSLGVFMDNDNEVEVLAPKKKKKKKKLNLKRMKDVAEGKSLISKYMDNQAADDYFENLPFIRSNVTCLC